MLSKKRLDYLILTIIYTLCSCAVILIFIELHSRDSAIYALKGQEKLRKQYASTMNIFNKYSQLVVHEVIATTDMKRMIDKYNRFSGYRNISAGIRRLLSAKSKRLLSGIYCGIELYSSSGKQIMAQYSNRLPATFPIIPGESIKLAIRRKKRLYGFEWGIEGCSFRFIYPIFLEKKFLGTIVLNISLRSVMRILSRNSGYTIRFAMLRRPYHSRLLSRADGSKRIIRISPGILIHRSKTSLITGIDDATFFASKRAEFRRGFASGQFFMLRYSLKKRQGIIAAMPMNTISGRRAGYLLVAGDDLTLIKRSRMYLLVAGLIIFILTIITFFALYVIRTKVFFSYSSTYDSLTGAFTRVSFEDFFEREAEKTKRYGTAFSLILFDIDHFADVNGRAGREAGDKVLQHLGDMVRGTIRKCDYFVRWGGEEFLLLLPETELPGAMVAAEKLRLHLKNFDFSIGIPITASFGVCRFKHKGGDVNDAVNRAVERLAEAKKKGGDRISVCDPLGV